MFPGYDNVEIMDCQIVDCHDKAAQIHTSVSPLLPKSVAALIMFLQSKACSSVH